MKKVKAEKAITLVALVITIIVLLILAGVGIGAIAGPEGLIAKVKQSAEEYNESARDEVETVNELLNILNGNKETITDEITTIDGVAKENYTIKTNTKNVEITIPKGFAPAILDENTGNVIGKMPSNDWKNISETDINNGLVIVDVDGNEFVWIPVDGINIKFSRYEFGNETDGYYNPAIEKSGTDIVRVYFTETTPDTEVQNSVDRYKGFYIGRYEAGIETERNSIGEANVKPKCKRDLYVYNFVTKEQAITLCNNMYLNIDTVGVGSKLASSYVWCTVLRWFQYNGIDVNNSSDWGNYQNSTGQAAENCGELHTTGFSNAWKMKNIYDLAGNVGEILTENSSVEGKPCTARGGSYNTYNEYMYAVLTSVFEEETADDNKGFRIVLYIK